MRVLIIRNGNANIMWYSSRNTDARRSTVRCASTWAFSFGSWRGTGSAKLGKASDDRSGAHPDLDSAEVLGVAGDGVYERQKCHPHCPDLRRQAAELCGAALLGTGLLGLDGRTQ